MDDEGNSNTHEDAGDGEHVDVSPDDAGGDLRHQAATPGQLAARVAQQERDLNEFKERQERFAASGSTVVPKTTNQDGA